MRRSTCRCRSRAESPPRASTFSKSAASWTSEGRRSRRPAGSQSCPATPTASLARPLQSTDPLQSELGHSAVTGSSTWRSYVPARRVKRLRGWSAAVSLPATGTVPVTAAGTLAVVLGAMATVSANQVDCSARRAKLGNRSSSMVPSARRSEDRGSSSSWRTTTGAGSATSTPSMALTLPCHTSSADGDQTINAATAIRGVAAEEREPGTGGPRALRRHEGQHPAGQGKGELEHLGGQVERAQQRAGGHGGEQEDPPAPEEMAGAGPPPRDQCHRSGGDERRHERVAPARRRRGRRR